MKFLSMDKLIEEFKRNPQCNSGRLRLDHYLVLETTNDFTGTFLTTLEWNGSLPYTCTWASGLWKQVRLYQNPFEGEGWSVTGENLFGMQYQFGPKYDCLVRNIDHAVLSSEIAALPLNGVKWWSMLPALAEFMAFVTKSTL
jgi:hypothetical protein